VASGCRYRLRLCLLHAIIGLPIERREDADPPGIVDDCVAIVGAVMSKQPLDRLGATFDVTKFEIVAGREAAIWLTTDITFSLAQKIDR
jgi:hypothetical protein